MKGLSEEKVRQRLRKLLTIANDKRIRDGQKANAKSLFKKLCKNHGIDPKTIREDGYEVDGLAVIEVQHPHKRIDALARCSAYLVGNIFATSIDVTEFRIGYAKLSFKTKLPQVPDESVRAYKLFYDTMLREWAELEDRYRRAGAQAERLHLFMFPGQVRKPHKRSFITGFYELLSKRVAEVKEARNELKQLTESLEEGYRSAGMPPQLQAPEPWELPPPNPLAVAVIPGPPPTAAPLPDEPMEEVPLPEDSEPAPISEDVESESDQLDQGCYAVGMRAARSIDLNEFKF